MDAYPEKFAGGLSDRALGGLSTLLDPAEQRPLPGRSSMESKAHPERTAGETAPIADTAPDAVSGNNGSPEDRPGFAVTAPAVPADPITPGGAGTAETQPLTRVAERQSARAPLVPPAATNSALSPVVSGRFMIQVVSLRDQQKADQFARKLVAGGYKPHVVAMDLGQSGKWFRVVLEGFPTAQEAQKVAAEIQAKMGKIRCVVLASEQKNTKEP